MAAPPATTPPGRPRARPGPSRARARGGAPRRLEWGAVLALAALALLSRVYTTNSLAGEPTSDEYLYAVHARDLARAWADGVGLAPGALTVEGRSVALEAALLSLVVPWDPLTLGRTIQAALNALCIPLTFILGRRVGLPWAAAAAAALLLLAAPEFQEFAWRFWTDSQATLLVLVYLSGVAAWTRRPSAPAAALALASLVLLVLTKESAAVVFALLAPLVAALPLGRRLGESRRARVALAALLALVGLVVLGLLARGVPEELARSPLLQRTFGAGPLVLGSIREAAPRVPAYADELAHLIGRAELGVGFLWASALGYAWLLAQALTGIPRRGPSRAAGWVLAAIAWAPGAALWLRGLGSLDPPGPWVALAGAALLVAIGALARRGSRACPRPWGLLLLGLVVLAVLAERLVISVTPDIGSEAAVTFRSFMPIVPLFALLAGGGVWAMASATRLLARRAWPLPTLAAAGATLLLVGVWSPLLRERLSARPLLGRVADRGADPDKAEGLRVELLVEAEEWLEANVRPTDATITSIPRHLAWYADLGVGGMDALINLGGQPRSQEERRRYILDRLGPTGAAYLVDFNVKWTQPDSPEARQWRETFHQLAGLPNVETAYLRRDRFGHPVFYVLRNHGYAKP